MIRKLEAAVFHLVLGPIPLLAGFLTGWWSAVCWHQPESVIKISALSGLGLGVLADGLWLRKWVKGAHGMSCSAWSGIFLFYSIGTYGFFMGMPACNVGLALPAGFVVGAILARRAASPDVARVTVRWARLVTTGVLALLCATSAWLGLRESSTGHELQSMLRLPFTVTQLHLVVFVIVGGAALLAMNWILVAATARWTIARLAAPQSVN